MQKLTMKKACEGIAHHMEINKKNVDLYARFLREDKDNILSVTGRGRHVSEVSRHDIAVVLLGLAASSTALNSPAAVKSKPKTLTIIHELLDLGTSEFATDTGGVRVSIDDVKSIAIAMDHGFYVITLHDGKDFTVYEDNHLDGNGRTTITPHNVLAHSGIIPGMCLVNLYKDLENRNGGWGNEKMQILARLHRQEITPEEAENLLKQVKDE